MIIVNSYRFEAATMEWRIGININQYSPSDSADQQPTDRWNDIYVNGWSYPRTLPEVLLSNAMDFEGVARGIGLTATGDVNNDWTVRGGAAASSGQEHYFGDNNVPINALEKAFGKNSGNRWEGTLTGLDPKKGYVLKTFPTLTSFVGYNSDMTVWATGAQGEVVSNTISNMTDNLTELCETAIMFPNNAGEIHFSTGVLSTSGNRIYNMNCLILEQHDVPVPTQTIGLNFYQYGAEALNDTNHPGLTDIWNNSINTEYGATVPQTLGGTDLLNFDGQPTGITISSITEDKYTAGNGEFVNDNSMMFTDPNVPDDCHRHILGWSKYAGGVDQYAHFLIEGLDSAKTYNIYVMETHQGWTVGQGFNFTAVGGNSKTSNTIDGFENTTDRCVVTGVTPDGSNEIALTTDARTNPPNLSEWFFGIAGIIIEEVV